MEKRRAYKRAVVRAKKQHAEQNCIELEKMVKNPKKWWQWVKKLKLVDKGADKADITKVYDKDRNVRTGGEAVRV